MFDTWDIPRFKLKAHFCDTKNRNLIDVFNPTANINIGKNSVKKRPQFRCKFGSLETIVNAKFDNGLMKAMA